MTIRQSTYQPRPVAASVEAELRAFLIQELRNISQAIVPNVVRTTAVSETQRITDRFVLLTTGAAGVTYTLLAPSAFPRFPVTVVKADNAAGAGTIAGTVSGTASRTLNAQYQALTIWSDGTALYATNDFSATGATLISGTYTPTLTNVANVAASTAYACQYMRVGSTVTVSGKVDVDPTVTVTSTQLGISLPIASALATAQQCAGTAFAPAIAAQGAAILGDVANTRAQMQWISGDVTNQAMYFSFSYTVV